MMTRMALWFTDPLAREVEPTKIPGMTEQLMLATLYGFWCGSSLAARESISSQMEDISCIVEAALVGVQYWIEPES